MALTLGASVTTPEGCAVLPETERAPCAQTVAGGYAFSSSVTPTPAAEVVDTALTDMTSFERAMVREARSQSGSLKVIAAVEAITFAIGLIFGVVFAVQ